jgi:hypothetical protein
VALISFWLAVFILLPLLHLATEYTNDQPRKTLINELVSRIQYIQITYTLTGCLIPVILFSYGPLPQFVCQIDEILRPAHIIQIVIMLDAILIIRYLFVFHLKNPTGTQDDFWSFFLTLWSFIASFLIQGVFSSWPGHNPNMFYICIGKFPAGHDQKNGKRNIFINVLFLISFLAHLAAGYRYYLYKREERKNLVPNVSTSLQATISNINKSMVTSLFTNFCAITFILGLSYAAHRMISMDKQHVNEFSEYIWIYMFCLYGQVISLLFALLMFFYQNPASWGYIKHGVMDSLVGSIYNKIKMIILNLFHIN